MPVSSEPDDKKFRIPSLIVLASFLILVGTLGMFKVVNRDLGIHLVSGRVILEQGLPETNVFSEIHRDVPIVPHEWLFQVLTFGIETVGGLGALSVARWILAIALGFLLWTVFSRRFAGEPGAVFVLGAWAGALSLFVAHERFSWRPDLVSLLFVAAFLKILIDFDDKRSNRLLILPVLQVIWVNIHGYFIVGLILLGCFLTGALIRRDRWVITSLAKALGLTVLACFLNPHFHKGALYPVYTVLDVFGEENIWGSTIVEMLSPWTGHFDHLWTYQGSLGLILVFALSTLGQGKRVSLGIALSGLAAISMYHTAFRNIGLLGVILGFCSLAQLNNGSLIGTAFLNKTKGKPWISHCLTASLLLASTFIGVLAVTNRLAVAQMTDRESGFGYVQDRFDPPTREFIEKNLPKTQMFNNFGIGSTYLWWYYPERYPFIAGYSEGYPHSFFNEAFLATQLGIPFSNIVESYGVEWVCVEIDKPLATALFMDESWVPIHLDTVALVAVRRLDAYVGLIESFDVRESLKKRNFSWHKTPVSTFLASRSPSRETRLAGFVLSVGYPDVCKEILDYAQEVDVESVWVWLGRAQWAMQTGDLQKAGSYCRTALRIDDNCADAFAMRAGIHVANGDGRMALADLHRATELAEHNPSHWALLSILSEQVGVSDTALRSQQKVVDLQPRNFGAHSRLGQLLRLKGSKTEALYHLKRSLELGPLQPQAEDLKLLIGELETH